jgi:hypothetical protein
VHGQYADACRALSDATETRLRHSLLAFSDVTLSGHRIAMLVSMVPARYRRERATLAALASVLAARPELRRALSDPTRAARLATDLANGMLPDPPTARRGSPDRARIEHALHTVGGFHRYGRPLPGAAMPSLGEIVALVQSRLRAGPDGEHGVDDRQIVKLARKQYLDVQPWPFAALLS